MTKLYLYLRRILMLLLVCSSFTVLAQERLISGKVTSGDDGSPLPGVNVVVKGTSNGTATDGDGKYSISVAEGTTLSFSYIGYSTQEIAVGSQTTIDVVLAVDAVSLQEVVVVGYGEVQKKDATGAVINMSTRDFNKGVLTSPQDLIVGKFAGVSVTTNSGAPGAGATIRVRGGASLNASNDPLIVIDGFPVDNTSPGGVANPLATINPNDIETFTVLKDASATAIYGSRASNGVIIITTKKGKSAKPTFSYNANVSVASPIKYVDVLNATEYKAMVNSMAQSGKYGIDNAALAKLGTADTDWQKEIFRTAVSHDHNLNVAGSFKNLPYRVSYGYTDQQGILKTTSNQRNSINLNLNPTLLDGNLKIDFSTKASWTNTNFGDAGAVGSAVVFDPTQDIYDANASQYGGYFTWLSKGAVNAPANPVALLNQTDNRAKSDRFIVNGKAEYKLPFLPDLKVVVNAGFDRATSDGFNRAPENAAFANNNGVLVGRNNTYSGKNQSELLDIYGNYLKQIGDHKIDLTAGYGWQHFYRDGVNSTQNKQIPVAKVVPFKSQNYLVSFFGRVNYSFKGKYLITATLRDDGSSRFGSKNRWGLFPSVALAWQLKDESFLSGVNFFSDLKLRAGYGVTGQQDVQGRYFPYLATYQYSDNQTQYQLGYNTDGTPAFYTTARPNAYDGNIRWESTATSNIGLDFGFMNDRITGSVEVFQKNTTDLLNFIPIPNGVNFSNYLTTNVGSMVNKGVELTLKADVISTPDLVWNVGANFTSISSKITKLNLSSDPSYPGVSLGGVGVGAFIQNHQVGYPASSFFVYQQIYDQQNKPIEGLYVDRSGQGGPVVGSDNNKYRYRRPVPDYLIGLNSRLKYKQLDFSFSGRISIGNYVYNNVQSGNAFYNGIYTLQHFNNTLHSITDTNFSSQQIYSDYYVQNASFFKMDNISVGYTLDGVLGQRLKARVSGTVQNAFIITKYKGIDPEVDGGIDNNIYPRPRTFLLGLNVTF
ncbi:MAG: TonB-dependent receptor [Cyclobacteriaceae bacterium]